MRNYELKLAGNASSPLPGLVDRRATELVRRVLKNIWTCHAQIHEPRLRQAGPPPF